MGKKHDRKKYRNHSYAALAAGAAIVMILLWHLSGADNRANAGNDVANDIASIAEQKTKIAPRPLAVPTPISYKTIADTSKESYEQAHRCLAQAIYFEARSEPVEGWNAVADVVLHRVLDKRYPSTICGVVFQGEYRRHRCQFSFACDGRSDNPKEYGVWGEVLKLAENKLERHYLPPLAQRATHYHADSVRPQWSKSLNRLTKIGRHIFYAESTL